MEVDAAFADILTDPRMALRPPPPGMDLEVLRKAADTFMATDAGPLAVEVQDLSVVVPGGQIPVRLYNAAKRAISPLIVFIHGGGFVFGSIETHDAICRHLAVDSDAIVASIGYRLLPEASFPTPIDDCVAAFDWLVANAGRLALDPSKVAVVGDSAGGYLAISTALGLVSKGRDLRHLGLFYPMIDPDCDSDSARDHADGFMLTRSFLEWSWALYRASPQENATLTFDLRSADLSGLPPITLISAGFDPLRDEGEDFAARAIAAGTAVQVRRYDTMIHGFAGFLSRTPMAKRAISEIADACQQAFAD